MGRPKISDEKLEVISLAATAEEKLLLEQVNRVLHNVESLAILVRVGLLMQLDAAKALGLEIPEEADLRLLCGKAKPVYDRFLEKKAALAAK